MLGARAAASARGVEEAGLGELFQQPARGRRLLVVAAEGVGEASVRVADDVDGGDPRHRLHVRAHLGRAQRAVDAGGEGLRMLDRGPERLDRLPGKVAAASVDDRDRDEQRNLGRDFLHRGDGGLAVQRVEDGLNEEDVDAAFLQRAGCLRVAVAKLVERDIAIRRIVDSR